MSHALDMSNGKAAIAYRNTNGKPWHGFGAHITDDMSTAEIASAAGLDFRVEKAAAFYNIPNPAFDPDILTRRFGKYWDKDNKEVTETLTRSYENRAVLYRSDNGEALSVMSESHYVPAQPIELLEGLTELTKGSGFEIDVCGALKGGRVVWALAKRLDGQADIAGDVVLPYVLLLTSYDGTYARTGRLTSVRVVCQNTVSLSGMMDAKTTSKQRNSAEFNIDRANMLFDNLGQYDAAFAEYLTASRDMSKVRMTSELLERYFGRVYAPNAFKDADNWIKGDYDLDAKGITGSMRKNVTKAVDYFLDSPGSNLQSADGTLWGALNAVTFYQDHTYRTRENKRWESTTIGNGNKIKDSALGFAMELIGV